MKVVFLLLLYFLMLATPVPQAYVRAAVSLIGQAI